MSDEEIKPKDSVIIKKTGTFGMAVTEKTIGKGKIKKIRFLQSKDSEPGEIELDDGQKFFLSSNIRIVIV